MIRRIAVVIGILLGMLIFGAVVLVSVGIFFFSSSSCGASIPGGPTLPAGRSISANADSLFIGLETSKDSATIRTTWRTVLVEPTRISIDGHFIAAIPATAKDIVVQVHSGDIVLTADGKMIEPGQNPDDFDEEL
jgi:hypothetical protein